MNCDDSKGFSLIEIALAVAILIPGIYFFAAGSRSGARAVNRSAESAYASAFSVELVEYFRAIGKVGVLANLSTNPFDSTMSPYLLCAHINLLDRATNQVINPDPMAALPPSPLDLDQASQRSNRFYKVEIVDNTTLAVNTSRCGLAASTVVLAANESYYVTVGITWLSKGDTSVKRVALGTLVGG